MDPNSYPYPASPHPSAPLQPDPQFYPTSDNQYPYPNYYNPLTPHQSPPPLAHSSSSHHGSSSSSSNSLHIVPLSGSHHHGKGTSLRVLLLHGNLDIWVCEARNLPNMDMFSKTVGDILGPRISSLASLESLSSMTSDPYVSIVVSGAVIGRTYVVHNSENPNWMQHFNVPVAHSAAEVEFLIKDNDVVGSEFIGNVMIPVEQIYSGQRVEGIYPVLGANGKHCRPGATLRISIQYVPIERLEVYRKGIGAGPVYNGVAGTYFPLRKGGRVTLYQDAHVPEGYLPDLRLEGDRHYEHGQCWVDMYEAMWNAKHLIYIVGWSLLHTLKLVRDGGRGMDMDCSLGNLLKDKARAGVMVLLLLWDDPTSRSILGYKTTGVMGTHDEETRRFFKHSSVQVLLCPRSAGKRHSLYKKQETGIIFTHHQKTVIVDADAGNYKRKIIAFVGGLDLCGGRYDTPKHSLFRTLQTLHKEDFHQPNVAVPDINGPREPWHDLHTRIDGPAAYDVLANFEERWMKASKRHGIKKMKRSNDESLLKIERVPEMLAMHESVYLNDTDSETWHVQIFRSIDSNSARGFPKDPNLATRKNLVCGKNVLIDMSIHTAYVEAIRSAQHFIYIENQYFLGSSFNWKRNNDLGANNLIPIEIALKIANKIKANERFSAYIVIPMWPEGNPTSITTQRILFWQKNTMQLMYETIYEALKEKGLEDIYKPQDYLNFFCLGNREALDPEEAPNKSRVAANSPIGLAHKNRRFMIYVHSKGMIVDDEYLIVGSANINQRSLEGTRDTEIAMAAYQPEHTWARKVYGPRGQIYGYRMSLWAEHIGTLEECFTHPESLECMRRVQEHGEKNWIQFAGNEVTDMKGHLLKYPVSVGWDGKVGPLVGCEKFPDLGGDICGSISIAPGRDPLTS